MDQVFEFVGNHPILIGSFAVLLALFIRNEMARGGQSVSAQQLVDLVNREGAVVVDVREKNEFASGHIVDAINIPLATLENRLSDLEKKKAQPIVIACKMGQHSGSAGTILRKNGFENVRRLTGGIAEWRNQNLPVVRS
jgi:rhodanese-related sulfurtransferase